MKFRYNEDKNAELISSRGIGFEEIIFEIQNGNCFLKTIYPSRKATKKYL